VWGELTGGLTPVRVGLLGAHAPAALDSMNVSPDLVAALLAMDEHERQVNAVRMVEMAEQIDRLFMGTEWPSEQRTGDETL
jgi:hypothetical protein